MNQLLLLAGVVIAACILMNRIATKLPIPSLLIFIALGMCFGVNGFLKISFDDYALSESICSACLIFIMFYGGFGTNIKEAKPVAVQAFTLSTAGVVMTAGITGVFVYYILKLDFLESMLIGSVIASTDAASVFNVLRSQKLSLKNKTDSLLELESGSNDPISYMLTVLLASLIMGKEISVPLMLFKQMAFGIICGLLIGKLAAVLLNRVDFYMEQGKTIFLFARSSCYACGIAGCLSACSIYLPVFGVGRAPCFYVYPAQAVWCVCPSNCSCVLGWSARSRVYCVFYLCRA